ncbi:lysophospholipase [bacterium]|nr:lysophospholipase [bacterium]
MSLPFYKDHSHWEEFFSDPDELLFFKNTIEEKYIPSGDTQIHLDIYEQTKPSPTVVYCHGLSSCGRMMGHMIKGLFKASYNVICPDLVGFGMTTKPYGSGTISEFVQNLFDTVNYANKRFGNNVYLAGISMGGGLSYYAAAAGANVKAIASLCLMDFGSNETLKINRQTSLMIPLKPVLKLAAKLFPKANLPLQHFLQVDYLCDDTVVKDLFKTNPLVIHNYTLSAGYSLVSTKPLITFEQFNKIPTLVLHGREDKLLPASLSKKNYDRLKCKKKFVLLGNCEHIPVAEETLLKYAQEMDAWFSEYH